MYRSRTPRLSFLLLILILTGATTTAQSQPALELEIDGQGAEATTNIGNELVLTVRASGIPEGSDGLGLFGVGFSILFDPAGLSLSIPTAGPLWTGTGFDGTRSLPGDVGLTSNRFFENAGPSGDDILVATIEIQALAPGIYPILLASFSGGAGDNTLFDGTVLDDRDGFFTAGSLQIIPEPGTALLVGLGVAGLASRRAQTVRNV